MRIKERLSNICCVSIYLSKEKRFLVRMAKGHAKMAHAFQSTYGVTIRMIVYLVLMKSTVPLYASSIAGACGHQQNALTGNASFMIANVDFFMLIIRTKDV